MSGTMPYSNPTWTLNMDAVASMIASQPHDFAHDRQTTSWRHGYHLLPNVINAMGLKVGCEIGVANAGHADAILSQCPGVTKLYGVDPYRHREGYDDLMNVPQEHFDAMHDEAVAFMRGRHGGRFAMCREQSVKQAELIREFIAFTRKLPPLDFVYIDGEHSYDACKADIAAWYPLIRTGGVLSGHDYNGGFPGVTRAVDEFVKANGLTLHVPEPQQMFWYCVKGVGL